MLNLDWVLTSQIGNEFVRAEPTYICHVLNYRSRESKPNCTSSDWIQVVQVDENEPMGREMSRWLAGCRQWDKGNG